MPTARWNVAGALVKPNWLDQRSRGCQLNWHPREALRAHVRDKRSFGGIALMNGDLPVLGIAVERRVDLRLSERVVAIVHPRDRV